MSFRKMLFFMLPPGQTGRFILPRYARPK